MEPASVPRKGCMDGEASLQMQGLLTSGLLSEVVKIFYILVLYTGLVTAILISKFRPKLKRFRFKQTL